MNNPTRMSPMTALFLGLFFVGAVAIASAATVILYGMRIIDSNATALIRFAGNTVEGLPELVQGLPPAIGDLLHDRRAPEYTGKITVDAKLITDNETGAVRPALTIRNTGDEVVALLALHVAVLDTDGVPRSEWTEVVATPLAVDGDWRGPIMPGSPRYVVLSGRRSLANKTASLMPVVEIGDVWVWEENSEGRITKSQ